MEKGPERLGEILSRLFTVRGWGRRREVGKLARTLAAYRDQKAGSAANA